MARHRELQQAAIAAWNRHQMGEASLLFRQAAEAALAIGDRRAHFGNLVWAAQAAYIDGELRVALALLLDARIDEPADARVRDTWDARTLSFQLELRLGADYGQLRGRLDGLRDYAQTHRVPAADCAQLEATLAEFRGDWRRALEHAESGWRDHDGEGYLKIGLSTGAARVALRMGELDRCRTWLEAGSALTGPQHNELARIEVLLALAEARPFDAVQHRFRAYLDSGVGMRSGDVDAETRELSARVSVLDPAGGDPAEPLHPSRAELRRLPRAREDIRYRYDAHLVHLDYRLACLRYAAGVPAVDDLYYATPQKPAGTPTVSPAEFRVRLRRARATARHVLGYARDLDQPLECDYRQREVEARIERIDQLVAPLRDWLER